MSCQIEVPFLLLLVLWVDTLALAYFMQNSLIVQFVMRHLIVMNPCLPRMRVGMEWEAKSR
ncbi:hypothetical protein C0V75_12745 [Tabrizicola sp. TH137]|nr:hypothetical protein C0V75_12745 [Tabrizicola sp. TH137]